LAVRRLTTEHVNRWEAGKLVDIRLCSKHPCRLDYPTRHTVTLGTNIDMCAYRRTPQTVICGHSGGKH
jgi:hypothetical protein